MKFTRFELRRQLKRSLAGNILMMLAALLLLGGTFAMVAMFKASLAQGLLHISVGNVTRTAAIVAIVIGYIIVEYRFAPSDCLRYVRCFYDASEHQKYPVREWNWFMSSSSLFWRAYLRLNVWRSGRVWRTAHLASAPATFAAAVRREGTIPLAS